MITNSLPMIGLSPKPRNQQPIHIRESHRFLISVSIDRGKTIRNRLATCRGQFTTSGPGERVFRFVRRPPEYRRPAEQTSAMASIDFPIGIVAVKTFPRPPTSRPHSHFPMSSLLQDDSTYTGVEKLLGHLPWHTAYTGPRSDRPPDNFKRCLSRRKGNRLLLS